MRDNYIVMFSIYKALNYIISELNFRYIYKFIYTFDYTLPVNIYV